MAMTYRKIDTPQEHAPRKKVGCTLTCERGVELVDKKFRKYSSPAVRRVPRPKRGTSYREWRFLAAVYFLLGFCEKQ